MPPKKDFKKEVPKKDNVTEVGFLIVVCIFIVILWTYILNYFTRGTGGSLLALWQDFAAWFVQYVYPIMIVLAVIISVLAIIGIFRNLMSLMALQKEEEKVYGPAPRGDLTKEASKKNEKWERVLQHINSPNASDWRLAIIESDIILDELLRAEGYHGDTIGDMLKGVDKSDMLTLEAAWEAHKVRNQIAHSGSDYLLNERDAKHTIALFDKVFKEAKII